MAYIRISVNTTATLAFHDVVDWDITAGVKVFTCQYDDCMVPDSMQCVAGCGMHRKSRQEGGGGWGEHWGHGLVVGCERDDGGCRWGQQWVGGSGHGRVGLAGREFHEDMGGGGGVWYWVRLKSGTAWLGSEGK